MLDEAEKLGADLLDSLGMTKWERYQTLAEYGIEVSRSWSQLKLWKYVTGSYSLALLVRLCLGHLRNQLAQVEWEWLKKAFESGLTPSYEDTQRLPLWHYAIFEVDYTNKVVQWSRLGRFFVKWGENICLPSKEEVKRDRLAKAWPQLAQNEEPGGAGMEEKFELISDKQGISGVRIPVSYVKKGTRQDVLSALKRWSPGIENQIELDNCSISSSPFLIH